MSEGASTLHACSMVLGNKGLLIRGGSGSGKSGLAQLLINRWNEQGKYSRWISDDRTIVYANAKHVLAEVPESIEGKAEQRYRGIQTISFEQRCLVDLVVDLVEPNKLERLPEPQFVMLAPASKFLPLLRVPKLTIPHAADLVSAQISDMTS